MYLRLGIFLSPVVRLTSQIRILRFFSAELYISIVIRRTAMVQHPPQGIILIESYQASLIICGRYCTPPAYVNPHRCL